MSRKPSAPAASDEYADEPLYWFAILDQAVGRGDHQAAAEAQAQLERLGISVKYRGRRPEQPGEVRRGSR
jgi:hypothetical protein